MVTGTTIQIGRTVAALNALLQLITSTVVVVMLLMGLLVIDAPVALSAAALGTAYGVLAIISRRALLINSQKITEASTQQLKALQEGLGAIRDVLLGGS